MHVLTRAEASERAGLIEVRGYDVALDLTIGPERFGSRSTIRFACRRPGAESFAEIDAPVLSSAILNGEELDLATALVGDRLRLMHLRDENELTVIAECAYSHSGEGLHRFTDPADGEIYTYSQLFLYEAHRVFACFDQPDLKAPWRLEVTAPASWIVLSNSPGRDEGGGHWTFDRSPPISTYFAAIVAGPYHHLTTEHDGIPLGLACRRSLARHLEADELFDVTIRTFDHYHARFGIRYPWTKYDQAFVPEFNAGAMENPGCVTFRDELVFRSRVTDDARERRSLIVAHEMSHMWFGDLVTMRWWDDLWLNESFAEHVSTDAIAVATRFRDAWATFAMREKAWGYRQDQLPTTHPVAGEVPDSDAALLNFDGISYAKGAAVLHQLDALVGSETSNRAYRDYFERHRFANATIADYLGAIERASGRELGDWARAWIRTAGMNTLTPELRLDDAGRYTEAAIVQRASPEHPTLRPHRVAIGLYDRSTDGGVARRDRLEIEVVGERTPVPALVGAARADLVLINDDDLTWAKIRFDRGSMEALLRGDLARIRAPLTRAVGWNALWDLTRDGELPVGVLLDLVIAGLDSAVHVPELTRLLEVARQAIDLLGDPDRRHARLGRLAGRCAELLPGAEPGGSIQLALARAFATSVATDEQVAVARSWLDGHDVPSGLVVDEEFRWAAVKRLAAAGVIGQAEIERVLASDPTSAGELHALEARASLPTEAAKQAAWQELVERDELSNHAVAASVSGFGQPDHIGLTAPYAERYFDLIRGVFASRPTFIGMELAGGLYPHHHVGRETVARTDSLLADPHLAPTLRRILVECRADLLIAQRAREIDRSDGS